MDIQIVHHDNKLVRIAIWAIAQVTDEMGEIGLGAALGGLDDGLCGQRFYTEENVRAVRLKTKKEKWTIYV